MYTRTKAMTIVYIMAMAFPAVVHSKEICYNRFFLSAGSKYYLNQYNVISDGIAPYSLQVKNTLGLNISLEYEYRFLGFIVNGGLYVGNRRHDISIIQDLSYFDSTAKNNLKDFVFKTTINTNLIYINPSINIGYYKNVNPKNRLVIKTGMFLTQYINGVDISNEVYVTYYTDDHTTSRRASIIGYEGILGEPNRNQRMANKFDPDRLFYYSAYVWQIYLGYERKINSGWFKSLNVGIEAARGLYWANGSNWIYVKAQPNIYSNFISSDKYIDRNVSIGLKLGVGFWR